MRYKILILVFIFVNSFCFGQSSDSQKLKANLEELLSSVINAEDISFEFSAVSGDGFVSFGRKDIYIKYKNKLEIYESNGSRYIFNKRKNRLDIDYVSSNDDNIRTLLDWARNIDDYIVKSRTRGKDVTRFTLTKNEDKETIEIDFSNNREVVRLSYDNKEDEARKLTLKISNMKVNTSATKDFFVFDPGVSLSEEIIVTDYRK